MSSGTAANKRKHDAPFVDMARVKRSERISGGRSIVFAGGK
jgi:hypothetical protein